MLKCRKTFSWDKISYHISQGGKLIQSVMAECGGVAIKFPESGSGSDKVTVRGPVDDVEKAVKLLKELSDEKQLSGISIEVG